MQLHGCNKRQHIQIIRESIVVPKNNSEELKPILTPWIIVSMAFENQKEKEKEKKSEEEGCQDSTKAGFLSPHKQVIQILCNQLMHYKHVLWICYTL